MAKGLYVPTAAELEEIRELRHVLSARVTFWTGPETRSPPHGGRRPLVVTCSGADGGGHVNFHVDRNRLWAPGPDIEIAGTRREIAMDAARRAQEPPDDDYVLARRVTEYLGLVFDTVAAAHGNTGYRASAPRSPRRVASSGIPAWLQGRGTVVGWKEAIRGPDGLLVGIVEKKL